MKRMKSAVDEVYMVGVEYGDGYDCFGESDEAYLGENGETGGLDGLRRT